MYLWFRAKFRSSRRHMTIFSKRKPWLCIIIFLTATISFIFILIIFNSRRSSKLALYFLNRNITVIQPNVGFKKIDVVISCAVCAFHVLFLRWKPRGGTPKILGRGVRPASQNPYPIYGQNLRFSLPYLWPDQKFDTLFMTWPLNQYTVSDLPYNYFPSSDQC